MDEGEEDDDESHARRTNSSKGRSKSGHEDDGDDGEEVIDLSLVCVRAAEAAVMILNTKEQNHTRSRAGRQLVKAPAGVRGCGTPREEDDKDAGDDEEVEGEDTEGVWVVSLAERVPWVVLDEV